MEEKSKRRRVKFYEVNRIDRNELADYVWEQSINITKEDARHFVKTIFDYMKTALLNGQEIRIHGFGTFMLYDRAEHYRRHNKTKRLVLFKRTSYVRFKPWPGLRQVHEQREDL